MLLDPNYKKHPCGSRTMKCTSVASEDMSGSQEGAAWSSVGFRVECLILRVFSLPVPTGEVWGSLVIFPQGVSGFGFTKADGC